MLQRLNLQSGPSNVQKRLITEPSVYLQQLQKLLAENQKKLNDTAALMQKSVQELESNIELTKQKLSTLELAKKKLEEELTKNNEQLEKSQDTSKVNDLQNKNNELLEEKQKIEKEMSQKLHQINDLETSLERKEKEWNENKRELVQRLKQFESQELVPYLNQIENIMQLTNSKMEASNTKLKKIMSEDMHFGRNDPFVSIGNKFQEKLVNREDLFKENYFGKPSEEDDEEEMNFGKEHDEEEMNFGKEHDEEDIEVEEIDEIDDTDSDSDGEMEFGSELDEECSEISDED